MNSTPFSNWPTQRGANETNSIPSRCSSLDHDDVLGRASSGSPSRRPRTPPRSRCPSPSAAGTWPSRGPAPGPYLAMARSTDSSSSSTAVLSRSSRWPTYALVKAVQVRVQAGPVEGRDLLPDRGRVGVLGVAVDLSLRVQRVEDEAGRDGGVDVLERLEMVGVTADRVGPPRLEGPPGRVVENVGRRTPAAAHLADRLLGEHGVDRRADLTERPDMTRGGEPEPVAEAGGGVQAEAGRASARAGRTAEPARSPRWSRPPAGTRCRLHPRSPRTRERRTPPARGRRAAWSRRRPLQPVRAARVRDLRLRVGAVSQRGGGGGSWLFRRGAHGEYVIVVENAFSTG